MEDPGPAQLLSARDLEVGAAFFRAADAALYRAKAAGRNCAWVQDGEVPAGTSDRSGN